MKTVPLSQGKVALVDDDDYEFIARFRWYAARNRHTWYAMRNVSLGHGKGTTQRMHRVILNAQDTSSQVDHRNGDGLDNRRENIRICSSRENTRNMRPHSSSGFKGVCFKKGSVARPWRARIRVNRQSIDLGHFGTVEEAARAYDYGALQHFGEFARLNFPSGVIR